MENNANQLNQNLCKKNCGFFGSSMFDGYCSKCHKEHVKRQNSGTAAGVLQTTQSSSNLNNNNTPQQPQPPTDIPLNELITTTTTNATITNETTTTTTTATPIIVDEQVQPTVQSSLPDNTPIEIDNVQTPTQIEQQQQQQPIIQQENATGAVANATASIASETESVASSSVNDDGTSKKKKTRCMVDTCRRKVGLTGFECRCNGLYCWEHRYSDKHNCQFDYKEFGQDQIRKNNPIVVGEKIQKL